MARLAHAARGRIRLSIPELRRDLERMRALVDRLADTPGLTQIRARPATGSVILNFIGQPEPIVAALSESGAVSLRPPEPEIPFRLRTEFGLGLLDAEIRKRSNGAFDARSALAALLLAAALGQLARGQVLGPSTTLLIGALALLSDARAR